MKKTSDIIQIFIVLIFFLSLFSCNSIEEKKETNEKNFEKQINSFSESLEDIDKTMNLVNLLNKKMEDIENKVISGEMTREDANKIAEKLNETYSREIAKRANINPASELPLWAKNLGLCEPNGLILDKDFSKETSVNDPFQAYNSIKLVYTGDYDIAIEQAKIIASKANIPLSKQYQQAFKFKEKYGKEIEGISGIVFMNYEFGDKNIEYKISISVNQKGELTINAVNMDQRNVLRN
ncbi:MAG: hypothetical protein K8R41_03065 [Bacteroidales bacterium]|nr:hypothetical protein [Bacteroidales bacterium]